MDQPPPQHLAAALSSTAAYVAPPQHAPMAFTITEACKILKVGRSKLYIAIQTGALRHATQDRPGEGVSRLRRERRETAADCGTFTFLSSAMAALAAGFLHIGKVLLPPHASTCLSFFARTSL